MTSKRHLNRHSDNKHDMDQQTKGKAVKHPTPYRNQYKGKTTYSDQPDCNRFSVSRRETDTLYKRIKSLEQWRAEMTQMKF